MTLSPDRKELLFEEIEAWHQVTCRSHSFTSCRFTVQTLFRARLTAQALGEVTVGRTSTSSFATIQSRRRGIEEVRKDQVDDFMALHVIEGEAHFSQDGRSLAGGRGDLFLYDQGRPWALDLVGRHHLAFLVIPRAAMTERLARAEDLTARALSRDAKAGDLARTIMHQLPNIGDLKTSAADRLGSAALDIMAAAFDLASLDDDLPKRHSLLKVAQTYMLDHLADNLDVERIAHALGVAPRTLNRIFASEGVTPMRWLWQQRLAAAYERLSRQRYVSATDVALECGFSNLPHFSRLFKETFGISPSAIVDR